MRFKRSELVKECLLAEMEGEPLPIGPVVPATKNPWKRQKVSSSTLCVLAWRRQIISCVFLTPIPQEFGFSRSLFGRRFGRNRAVPPSPPLTQTGPKNKKDSKGIDSSHYNYGSSVRTPPPPPPPPMLWFFCVSGVV